MPRYEYTCKKCEWHGLLWKPMKERNNASCPLCRSTIERTYTVMGLHNTQSPAMDNHGYNNGQGVYDKGLGEVIRSRRHRQEVMDKKGLHEVSSRDKDLFTKEWEHKPMTTNEARNQFEEAESMVSSGEWKKGLTEKRISEVESGRKKSHRKT